MHHTSTTWNRHGVRAFLSEIFTAAAGRALRHTAGDFEARRRRWFAKPLCLTALLMSLTGNATQRGRFRVARDLVARLYPKKVRPGAHFSGYTQALHALPCEVVYELRTLFQAASLVAGAPHPAQVGRYLCFGVDGTQQEMPRTDANVKHFGIATKEPALPQRQLASCFALGRRLLWDWEGGAGNASEPDLILEIIRRAPPHALFVKDAGTVGYAWLKEVVAGGHHLLMRVGGNFSFWAAEVNAVLEQGGTVLVWPQTRRNCVPLKLRLITYERSYCRKKRGRLRKCTERVYLLTDLSPTDLSREEAQALFALRWPGNEIGHRGWKRTLLHHKLLSENPALAERESDFSLLGCMFLQLLVLRALPGKSAAIPSLAEARNLWQEAVDAVRSGRTTSWFKRYLKGCVLDTYARRRSKTKRRVPRRKEHRPLQPPYLLRLGPRLKHKAEKILGQPLRASA